MEQNTLPLPQLLSEKQAARLLAVSVAALRRWRREGRGPKFARVEACIRYDLRAIEEFWQNILRAIERRPLHTRYPRKELCDDDAPLPQRG
jgi:hypothetical protein